MLAGAAGGLGRRARSGSRPAPEPRGAPRAAQRLDFCAPGGAARDAGLSARIPAGAGNPGRPARDLPGARARHRQALEVFPRRGQGRLLAARRDPVSRRTAGHRRRLERARRAAGCVGRHRAERLARVLPLLLQVVGEGAPGCATGEGHRARALQRLRGHRKLHQGWQGRHRPQCLDRLHGGRTLEHRLRHSAAAGTPHPDGRLSRPDPQRRRFRN